MPGELSIALKLIKQDEETTNVFSKKLISRSNRKTRDEVLRVTDTPEKYLVRANRRSDQKKGDTVIIRHLGAIGEWVPEDCHIRKYESTSRYEDNVMTKETRESWIHEDLACPPYNSLRDMFGVYMKASQTYRSRIETEIIGLLDLLLVHSKVTRIL